MAPLAFVRPAIGPRPRNVGEPLLLAQLCAARRARGSLEIVRDRFSGRTASQRQTQDFEFRNDALQRQAQVIAYPYAVRGLHSLGIQVHFAAIDGGRRETSRFEKSGMPQPFVQTMAIDFLGCHIGCYLGIPESADWKSL
jgi:hypothetical protein